MPPTVRTFFEARQLHSPPPLITYCEFDAGAGRATISSFDRPWRAVSTLGAAAVTAVSNPRVEGLKAMRVTWHAGNALTVIATTLATGLDLSALETIRFFVRSDKTGIPMRLGIGEASAGEYLPEVAAIVTANTFLERTVALDALVPSAKNAIKKLRLELYGKAGKGTTLHFFDNMHVVSRARYANIFTAKPGIIIEGENFEVEVSGSVEIITDGHAMDDTQLMDGTSTMGDGVLVIGDGAQVPPTDFSGQNSISAGFQANAVPATLRFGFGEATYSEHTYDFTIATANQNITKTFDISTIAAASRDAVRFFGLIPLAVPTSTDDFICSMNSLQAQRYFNPSPIVPYRVFKEKLIGVEPIMHAIGPVHASAKMARTSLRLDNHDSEFYRLRDNNPVLNRGVNVFIGFENLPDNESQVAMRGIVHQDAINDENYEVSVEDFTNKLLTDLPPNTIQDKQYIFPENYGAGSAVWSESEVPGWSRPHNQHLGRPIPMAFGHCFVPLYLIHRGFWIGTDNLGAIVTVWKFLDDTYGSAKEVVRIFRGDLAGEYHTYGSNLGSLTAVRNNPNKAFIGGWVSKPASGLIFGINISSEGGGAQTGGFVPPFYAEIRGYADDSDGQWTGNPGTTITNPSDVARFILMNVLKMDASEINLADLDSARTALSNYRVSRAIVERQTAFDLLGGRASQGGLASNVFAYFFASNVDGKVKLVPANTSVVTSGTYRATGRHANILRGSYRVRSQPERIITRIEVDTGYNIASASDHSFVSIVDTQAESYGGVNRRESLRIAGRWLPNDIPIMTLRYIGTASLATVTILGEGEDTEQRFRFTSAITAQNFSIDLTSASGNTISALKQTLANKAFLTATIGNAVSSSLDSRFLRSVSHLSIVTTMAFPTAVGRIKFGYGKMLAWQYLDYYNHNRDAVSWRSPWVGYQQEIGQYVDVRSLGESQTRTVKIMSTRRNPLDGTIDFVGEEVS